MIEDQVTASRDKNKYSEEKLVKAQEEINSIDKMYQEREAKWKSKQKKDENIIKNAESTIAVGIKQCAKDLTVIKKMSKIRVTLVEEIDQLQV